MPLLAYPFAGDVVAPPISGSVTGSSVREAVLEDRLPLSESEGRMCADFALEQFGDFHAREAFLNARAERGQEVHARGAAGLVADGGVEGHVGGVQPLLHLHDPILAHAEALRKGRRVWVEAFGNELLAFGGSGCRTACAGPASCRILTILQLSTDELGYRRGSRTPRNRRT